MDRRLSNWKVNSLSLATRQTLISSVASAIPAYTLQSTLLPVSTCDEIDKRYRQFLWGSSPSARKVHLVAWEDVCHFKEEGGLGLRMALQQNKAFMMKLGWGLIRKREALWVKFLREKYKCGNDILPRIAENKRGSQIWKGIKEAWGNVLRGLGWKLGDGHKVKFWEDCWLPGFEPLKSYALSVIDNSMREERVVDYVTESGGWCWHKLLRYLPSTVLNALDRLSPFSGNSSEDVPIWRVAQNGEFSVKSAYKILWPDTNTSNSAQWRRIWKLDVPQRVKTFVWLCMKGRLLTNSNRVARHMQVSASCSVCGANREDTIHILRDCQIAKECWKLTVPTQLCDQFFSLTNVSRWISWNIRQVNIRVLGSCWAVWFSILCRHLWINRNAGVFEGKTIGKHQIIAKTRTVARWSGSSLQVDSSRVDRFSRWKAPFMGAVKLMWMEQV